MTVEAGICHWRVWHPEEEYRVLTFGYRSFDGINIIVYTILQQLLIISTESTDLARYMIDVNLMFGDKCRSRKTGKHANGQMHILPILTYLL